MAEAWLNTLYGDHFEAMSAGLEPGALNPYAVQVMAEAGVDIAGAATKSVFDVHASGKQFDYVVTVCDKEAAERCPIFPGAAERLHWSFADPARAVGDEAEKLAQSRLIRDQIRAQIEQWVETTQG
jgi:arsenate reductase